jgi:hypothetical protein
MAWYPDLSPYEYSDDGCDLEAPARPDVSVGWLQRGHPFPTGTPPPGFVEALSRCSCRFVCYTRGVHSCEFCSRVALLQMQSHVFRGRPIWMGSSELHVPGPDGLLYGAPSTILHYVLAHRYLPPEAFVRAVLHRASTMHVVLGEEYEQLRRLSVRERYTICERALTELLAAGSSPWSTRLLALVRELAPDGERPLDPHHHVEAWKAHGRMWLTSSPEQLREPIPVQVIGYLAPVVSANFRGGPARDELEVISRVVETARDAGLTVEIPSSGIVERLLSGARWRTRRARYALATWWRSFRPRPRRHRSRKPDPEAMAKMDRQFYDRLGAERAGTRCAHGECSRGVIEYSAMCRVHHFEMVTKRRCPFSD